jgi:hypothetical protein
MVTHPVSHPSDVELRELFAISSGLLRQAANEGRASGSFHGFDVVAVRQTLAGECAVVKLFVARGDKPLADDVFMVSTKPSEGEGAAQASATPAALHTRVH